MELFNLEWNWKYVAIIFAFSLFVSVVSFDMIANWESKKLKDTRILLIGAGVFGLAVLLLTAHSRLTVLLTVVLLTVVLAGLMAVDNRFDTSKKPWELYVMAIFSLIALIGSVMWVYYNTRAGKYVQEKGSQFRQKLDEVRTKRRVMRENRLESKNSDTFMNPTFDMYK